INGGTLTSGVPQSFTISAPGQNAGFNAAPATEGGQISVLMSSPTLTTGTMFLVKVGSFTTPEVLVETVPFPFIEPIALPFWQHQVTIDPLGAQTGSGTITFWNVPPDTSKNTKIGATLTTSPTTVPGQNARLVFTGAAGARMAIKMTSTSFAGTNGTLSLIRPSGSTLVSKPWTSLGSGGVFIDALNLPERGKYTILVDPRGPATGTATVAIYSIADVTTTLTVGGPTKTVTTTTPGQNAELTFSG